MATCKYCGKWSGLFDDEHLDCAEQAKRPSPVPRGTITGNISLATSAVQVQQPLTVGRIAAGVMLGNLLSGVVLGLIYLLLYGLTRH